MKWWLILGVVLHGATAQAGAIHGLVLTEFGNVVSGAHIQIQCSSPDTTLHATSNENGLWAVDCPPGEVRVTVSYMGFKPSETVVRLSGAGQHTMPTIRLLPDPEFNTGGPMLVPYSNVGRVLDAETGEPLEGVLVLAWETHDRRGRQHAPRPTGDVRTDESGRYELELVLRSSILFWKEGYAFRIVDSEEIDPGLCSEQQFTDVHLTKDFPARPSN